jgi:hypothetical protein
MANASFRRSVLLVGPLPEGWLEVVLAPTIAREGGLYYDDAIVVSHVQPRALMPAMTTHFDNGRSCAGLARPHMARRDWRMRLSRVPILPWFLFSSVLGSLRGRRIPARARRSLFVMWLLCLSHAAGELVGLLLGEGGSARLLG